MESQPRSLNIIDPLDDSADTRRQRQIWFAHSFGPTGREFYRGLRDGSLTEDDLPQYSEKIDTHFFSTMVGHHIPKNVDPRDYLPDLEALGMKVVLKVIEDSFPRLKTRLGDFVISVKCKSPSPTTLFKVLALTEDKVDKTATFEVIRQLGILDNAGPLDVRAKNAGVNASMAYWNDRFNKELYEGSYEGVIDHWIGAYHDAETNRVVRFSPTAEHPFPPREGERFAAHYFSARRIKEYGLVFVDITEADPVSTTIKALVQAVRNKGRMQPTKDVNGSTRMTFVDLESRRGDSHSKSVRLLHLRNRVMEAMGGKDIEISKVIQLSSPRNTLVPRLDEFIPKGSAVPLKLEFLTRDEYLNRKYEVGEKELVEGIPVPVYNGPALRELRDNWSLLPFLFPKSIYGIDTRPFLLRRIDEVAEELKRECITEAEFQLPPKSRIVKPAQKISAINLDTGEVVRMRVQIAPADGRVMISVLGDRENILITTQETIAGGGEVDGGPLGKFTFIPPNNRTKNE